MTSVNTSLTIFTDGGARGNPGPAAIGIFVTNQVNQTIFKQGKFIGETTNNVAEYRAILQSLVWIKQFQKHSPVDFIHWKLDSKLVVEQVNKKWQIKNPNLMKIAQEIWQLLDEIAIPYLLSHIPREQNDQADLLVNQALDQQKK